MDRRPSEVDFRPVKKVAPPGWFVVLPGVLISLLIGCAAPPQPQNLDWSIYGNDYANTRYSHLDQVNTENVAGLRVACAHCHGPSAKAVEDKVDLRLLHRRHGNLAQRVFQETVMYGRPGTEMPEWRETLADKTAWLNQLQAFIFSIQRE